MRIPSVLLVGAFIVSWRVSGQQPVPCDPPKQDAWGQYDLDRVMAEAGGICTKSFFEWKLAAFDTQDEVDRFLETKPKEGVENVTVIKSDDAPRNKK